MDEFVEKAAQLTTNYVSTRSLAVIVRDRAGNATTGTSICIEVGDHLLLATAGHVIDDMNDDRLELLPAGELSTMPVSFATRSCRPGSPAPSTDVAWLEVEPRVARAHNLRFLALSDLKPYQVFDRQHAFLIHGYPHDSAVLGPTTSDVESTIAFSMIAEEHAAPHVPRPFEIALEYPPRDAEGRPMQAPDAFGFSGGGVWWHPRHDEGMISGPERLRLVAINTRWHIGSAILYGTRIEHWLQLVAHDFPDASSRIEEVLNYGKS